MYALIIPQKIIRNFIQKQRATFQLKHKKIETLIKKSKQSHNQTSSQKKTMYANMLKKPGFSPCSNAKGFFFWVYIAFYFVTLFIPKWSTTRLR